MDELTTLATTLSEQRRAVRDDDAVQDAFLTVAAGNRLSDLHNAPGFWYRIAVCRRIDAQRASARVAARTTALSPTTEPAIDDDIDDLLDDLDSPVLATVPGADPTASGYTHLNAILPALAPARRALIEAELSGVTDVAQLAAVLDRTPGAVRVLRHRTYEQLRRLLAAA